MLQVKRQTSGAAGFRLPESGRTVKGVERQEAGESVCQDL